MEDTDGCANKYRCALSIYLTTVLSFSYDIIKDHKINAPGNGNNVVDGLNVTDKCHLKGKLKLWVN